MRVLYLAAPLALLAGCQSATTTATNDVYALASTLTAAETAAAAYEHSASPDPAIVAQIKAADATAYAAVLAAEADVTKLAAAQSAVGSFSTFASNLPK
jgi:hypothetical protein